MEKSNSLENCLEERNAEGKEQSNKQGNKENAVRKHGVDEMLQFFGYGFELRHALT